MTPLASKVLEIATAELGTQEDPPGSNRGPRVDEYIRSVGLDPEKGAYPWCAAFVCWCIEKAGKALDVKPKLRKSASVLQLLQRNPEAQLDRAEPGSIFIHLNPNETGHTGFVVAVDPGLSVATIEGNSNELGSRTGGSVVNQFRANGYIAAFLMIE